MNLVSTSRRKRQSGNVMIETSFCLISLFMIMFGIVEYSRLTYAWNFVSYAARSATRYGSLRGSTSSSPVTAAQMTSYVQSLAVALNPSSLVVNTTWSPNNQPGSTIQVVVSYTESPVVTMVMPNSINVTSTSQMVILQ
jgi:Flp pilus assembly protein TadG